jgi:hypothetical protein
MSGYAHEFNKWNNSKKSGHTVWIWASSEVEVVI